jgi:FkbM family methyltransferase
LLRSITGAVPLNWFYPFRRGAVAFRRGNPLRSFCVAVVKRAAPAHRADRANLVVRPLDMPEVSFQPADSMVMDAVYWLGVQGYEGCVAATWQLLCSTSRHVLEVGGNVGLFAVLGGRATAGRYTVVEPVPHVAAILRANLHRNHLDRVEVLQAAAIPGDTRRTVTLSLPGEDHAMPVGAHLADGVEVTDRTRESSLAVDGIPFRELMGGCDLIKIDAEGIEFQLLNDSRDALLATRPTLLVEVLPQAERLGRFLAELACDAGYMIYAMPEYRLDRPVRVPADGFSAAVPGRYFAKDVVLTTAPL